MEKSRKRAERRWRSYCVWMRRLRRDWNEHGWQRNPIGPWRTFQVDGTSLCNCFFLDHPQAYRFKNTPADCACSQCQNPRRFYAGKRANELTVAERREAQGDRTWFGRRKRRRTVLLKKLRCTCGYVLGVCPVVVGEQNRLYRHLDDSWMRTRGQCPDCDRRQKSAGEFYGVNRWR